MHKRLWLALHFAPLVDLASITRIVVDFALAPAREAWGLPAPRSDERDDFLFIDQWEIDGMRHRLARNHRLDPSAAHFEPTLRGLLLFGWLFPGAGFFTDTPSEVAKIPGWAFLDSSQTMAYRTHDELVYLARGLFGDPGPKPWYHGSLPFVPQLNEPALAELGNMKDLLARAVGAPEDFGDYRRLDTGLNAVDWMAAHEIDEILRRDVHQRLVWLGHIEPVDLDDEPISAMLDRDITFDYGVLSVAIPESLSGLVALDFVESLRLDRAAGRCHRCLQPMVLKPQQRARARRGAPVFHPDCFREHRLTYGREYQRSRTNLGKPNRAP